MPCPPRIAATMKQMATEIEDFTMRIPIFGMTIFFIKASQAKKKTPDAKKTDVFVIKICV